MGGLEESGGSGKKRRILLKDVAQAAGISEAQTSAALSGQPGVREVTRQRVREVAAELGYQPSEHARRLGSRRRAGTRCVVVLNKATRHRGQEVIDVPGDQPDEHALSPFVGRMVEGVLMRACEIGIDVRLVHWPDLGGEVTRLAAQDAADAVLVPAYTGLALPDVAALEAAGLPFVLLNRHFHDDPVTPSVVADVSAGVEEAVDRLVAGGHRRLVLMIERLDSSVVADYLHGWQTATRRLGVSVHSQVVQVDHSDVAARDDAIASILDSEDRATAVVAASEIAAHEFLRAATARGLTVPRDLSLVTFESVISPYTTPPLSGFDLNLTELGARAVDRIAIQLGLIPGEELEGTEHIPPRYVERDSTGTVTQPRQA